MPATPMRPSNAALRTTRKRLMLGLAAALAVAVLAWALWPRPVGVDAVAVTAGPMKVSIDEEGKTRVKEVFVVSAPQAGSMLRSPLTAGDTVEKGKTLVALLQPARPPFLDMRARLEVGAQVKAAEAAVQLAEAELAQARSEAAFAEAELKRTRSLAQSSTVSERALERAEADAAVRRAAVARAEAGLAVRQSELESSRAKLVDPDDETLGGILDAACCVEVRAPVSGRVLRVLQTSEQVLPAGTPLAEVGDPRAIEIVVELISADAVRVAEGSPVSVEEWGGQRLEGRVRRVEAAGFTKVSALGIEEQRVRVIIDLVPESLARHRLGHEFRVMARIQVWQDASVLRVPVGALFRNRGDWAAFRIRSGRSRLVRIKLGQRNSEHAQVLEGLMAGDMVVLHPSDRVVDGVRVSARLETPLP